MVRVVKLFESGQIDATAAMKLLSASSPIAALPPPLGSKAAPSAPSEGITPTEMEASEAEAEPDLENHAGAPWTNRNTKCLFTKNIYINIISDRI